MRTLILTVSAVFFSASFLVTALTLSLPSGHPPAPDGRARQILRPLEPERRDPVDWAGGRQGPDEDLVRDLQATVAGLREEIGDGKRDEALEKFAREQAAGQIAIEEMKETIGRLKQELGDSGQDEALEKIVREQAAGQAVIEELKETIAGLKQELNDREQGSDRKAHEPGQRDGGAAIEELKKELAGLREEIASRAPEPEHRGNGDRVPQGETEAPAAQAAPSPPEEGSTPVPSREGSSAPAGTKQGEARPRTPGWNRPAGGRVIAILGGGLFGSGQAVLTEELEGAVRRVLPDVVSNPTHRIIVEGHSDSSPIGSELSKNFADNLALSLIRAESVARLLEEAGLPRERISVAGYGDARPLMPNDTPDGRAENRRVEIWLVPPSPDSTGGTGGE